MTRARVLADYVAGGTTAAEFDHLDGVTSNVQTQLDAKLPLAGGTMTGDLVPSTPFSHRNIIINGAMNVAQRGTQVTSYNANSYATVDRFKTAINGLGNNQIDQATVTDLDGFSKSWKHTYTYSTTSASSAGYYMARYLVEAQDLQRVVTDSGAAGCKAMTLSFYVKSSWADTFYTVLESADGTSRKNSFSYTTLANTWKRVEHNIPADSVVQFDNNNAIGLDITWWLAAGSNFCGGTGVGAGTWSNYTNANQNCVDDPGFSTNGRTWEITGVQLELGSSATPFEHRSYGDELARCQRYYEHDPLGSGNIWGYPITHSSDGYRRAPIYFKVPKRASPSTNVTSTGNTAPTVNQNMSTNGFAVAWNGVSDGNYKEVTSWTANSEL